MHKLETSIHLEQYENIVELLYRIPLSLNQILNQEYLDELIVKVKNMETGILQVKLLSMIQERADSTKKLEVRQLLMQKIMFLSQKIASSATGITKSVVSRYRPGLDEIDVDRSLEEQLGHPALDYEKIFCHEKVKQKSAYVLMLDTSNSMHQEKIAIASIATGVFANKLRNDYHGVITFARDVTIITHLNEHNNLEQLVDKMLDIKSGGSTNIREALIQGLKLLNESKSTLKTGILVTDGWVTTGGDPVGIAKKFERLHVLGISFGIGGSDPHTNRLIAKKGRGQYKHVGVFDDLPIAITKILTNKY